MGKKLSKFVCAVLILLPVCTNATDIAFTSSGTITDGNIYASVGVQNSGTVVDMSGGQISNHLGITYGGTFNMSGGLISGHSVYIGTSGIFNITDGTMDIFELAVMEDSTCNIMGGDIAIDVFKTSFTSIINISGYDFNYNPTTEVLTGHLLDDNFFTIAGVDASEYAQCNLIPEPTSLLILSFGLLVLRKQKKITRI